MRKKLLLPLLLLSLIFTACEKNGTSDVINIITEGPISVEAATGTATIEFESTTDWEASVTTSDKGGWCTLDKNSGTPTPPSEKSKKEDDGSQKDVLTIVASLGANDTNQERNATITIVSKKDIKVQKSITINQEAKE